MVSWLDDLDNALGIDSRSVRDVDRVRIARLRAIREFVSSQLDTFDADAGLTHADLAAFLEAQQKPTGSEPELSGEVVIDFSQFCIEPLWLSPLTLSLSLVEAWEAQERWALRRVLRLLNKVITIALRREAFLDSLRQLVLRLRAFFVTHGNHPPDDVLRHRLMPEGAV